MDFLDFGQHKPFVLAYCDSATVVVSLLGRIGILFACKRLSLCPWASPIPVHVSLWVGVVIPEKHHVQ